MSYGMYISAAGADAQSRRLEILSNNLANVDTPGFKRELAIPRARYSEAIERGAASPGSRSINDVGGGVQLRETATDFASGVLQRTNIDTDFAIDGDGFFQVQKDGQSLLTRAGNFRFTADGKLVNRDGYAVLDDGGNPITIDPVLPWRILENGTIEQAGEAIPLAVMKPASLGDLVKVGENLFSPLAPAARVDPSNRKIASGFLERSTVSPTTEMTQLIETTRAYEANIKMIQNHDSVIGSLVNRLLRQS